MDFHIFLIYHLLEHQVSLDAFETLLMAHEGLHFLSIHGREGVILVHIGKLGAERGILRLIQVERCIALVLGALNDFACLIV